MRRARASRTAAHNGLFRALESAAPAGERLFDDDLVPTLLPVRYRLLNGLARRESMRRLIIWAIDTRWPGVRSSVVARTRLIDELITKVADEVVQVVILGAGLDTRAHRLRALTGMAVFEVDHPATQQAKRRALERLSARGSTPAFVSHDFRTGALDADLRSAGYCDDAATLIVWEGVTNYLSAMEVDETLRWCSRAAPGSQLIFTYVDERVLREPSAFPGAERALSTVRRAGEEMTFGLSPADLTEYLETRGLTLRSDRSAADFRAMYYGAAASEMWGHEFYHVAHAVMPEAR